MSALLPAMIFHSASGVGWVGPTVVTSTNNSSLHYSSSVVQDNAGNVYLFWDENPGIYYTVTNTGQIATNTWPTPQLYTKNVNYDLQPAPVALKNGTLILFFSSKRGNQFNIYYSKSNDYGTTWSTENNLTSIGAPDTGPSAIQDSSGNIWVAWTRKEAGDLNIRFVNSTNSPSEIWAPGKAIVYDANGDRVYETGEPVIYGSTPATGTRLKFDARIGFVDGFGYGVWKPGDFVVYDPNTDSVFDPHLMYVDSDNNNVWDPGESIVYKANSTNATFGGTGRCTGTSQPGSDCVIIGSVPSSTTILRIDPQIKFVDLNGDGLWEPGETLVYDVNNGVNGNSGQYVSNDIAIPALIADPNLRFIGSGSTWTSGNTVVYDRNGNGVYDGGIMYVKDILANHWVPGDTVVYHNNGAVNVYGFTDTLITGTSDDIGKALNNDPGLRFVDLDGNGIWEPGEPVTYDSNRNGIYDGTLMFVNATMSPSETWASGKAVVYDADGDGRYIRGKYVAVNDTIIAGTVGNNTALRLDPLIKFNDANGNTVWDPGETVVYTNSTAGNPNVYQPTDPIIAGTTPALGTGLTTGLGEPVIATGAPLVGTILVSDPKLRYSQTGTNTTWTPGESVVYDTDGNGKYGYGKYDPNVSFVNSTTSPTETWTAGKAVVYDADGDGKYIVGRYVAINDTIISGIVLNNTAVKRDAKLDFVDCTNTMCDNNNRWEPGETIFYDSNGDGVYDSGETIIVGTAPPSEPVVYGTAPALGAALSNDPLIKFSDSNGNGVWDSAEPVVYDGGCYPNPTGCGSMQPGYAQYDMIRGTIPPSGTKLSYNIGDPWIAGLAPPIPGTILSPYDSKIKFVDTNANGHWDSTGVQSSQYSTGEPVVYDSNNSGIYIAGVDTIIYGSPVPPLGTRLKTDEKSLAGTSAAPGTKNLVVDSKMEFAPYGTNTTWVAGETVVYDVANTCTINPPCRYVSGKSFNDTIVVGAAPVNNTRLVSDTKLKYLDANKNGHWDIGEPVFYDSNNDGTYESNEPLVAVYPTPSNTAVVVSDSHIKYFETGTDTHWDPGESVVYDVNSTGLYAIGDPVIYGNVPGVGTVLSSDSNIKFVDGIGNGIWARGETVVYDSNADGKYETGEPIISGTPPTGSPLQSVTHILYKTYNGISWSIEQRATIQPYNDQTPSIRQTEDGRIWIVWSGQRPGGPNKILYKTSLDGVTWTSETTLTSSPADYGDFSPSILQDRNGTIWIAFNRNLACGSCGKTPFQADVFTFYSTNNGASWSSLVDLTNGTIDDEIQPSLVQLSDKNLYLFYSLFTCGSTTCTIILDYFKTSNPILIHDANMKMFTTNATSSITDPTYIKYGPNVRSGQVLRLNATVTNAGDYSDNFTLTVKANSTLVSPTNSSVLSPGQTKVIFINWKVSGLNPGRYILTATVTDTSGVEGFANLVDNTATFKILIRPAGDVNGDCVVDVSDLALIGAAFGRTRGQLGYNAAADLNNDGIIDVADLSILGGTFGQTC
jgi:hypothetical protein